MTTVATLDAGLRASVKRHGGRLAVTAGRRQLTYHDLDDAVEDAVGWLVDLGIVPGDRVLLQLDKGLAFLTLHLANMRLGSVTVPLDPSATPDEAAYAATDCRPRLFVRKTRQAASLAEEPLTGLAGDMTIVTVRPNERLVGSAPAARPAPGPDDLACLLYTSGTTGRPKGARLLHRQLAANITTLRDAWGWTHRDRLHHALPLFHTHGLFVGASVALASGASIELAPRFDTAQTWEALLSGRVSVFMGVPTMYHRLLVSAPTDLIRPLPVRLFTSGSAPLRVETLHAFEELTGHMILERYGMTEVGMAASNPLDGERKAGSVGPALPGVGLRIDRTQTAVTQTDKNVGEVQISGPAVFDGYWERPEQTAQAFTADGWLRSGDLGHLDQDGYLRLVGRTKELIISGGLNVYPREVESALEEHPAVVESAVCGVPDEDFGEVVVAGVVLRSGSDCDANALRDWVRLRLAPYKLPKRFAFLGELPRNAMGKVQKARLASLAELREKR